MPKFASVSLGSALAIAITYFLPYGTWAEIDNLPAHPLIVHGVVVLFPIFILVTLVALVKRNWFKQNHLYLIGGFGLVTIGIIAAKSSGDSLAAAVGLPELHAEWGNNLVPLAIVLFVSVALFSLVTFYLNIQVISRILSVVIVLLGVSGLGMTYVVGHSGAESAWGLKYESSKTALTSTYQQITMAEVKNHNSANDCWTVVDGMVYDVTSFVSRHPAGSSAIKEMCGVDASEDFMEEHMDQAEPMDWLDRLKIGELAG